MTFENYVKTAMDLGVTISRLPPLQQSKIFLFCLPVLKDLIQIDDFLDQFVGYLIYVLMLNDV